MKINILDLFDFKKVDTLLERFNKSTGFVTTIVDLKGKGLSISGWSQMCTDFYRNTPDYSFFLKQAGNNGSDKENTPWQDDKTN